MTESSSASATSITAVIVAYGPGEWLERCVESVLASSGADVDVVLVDNGDTGGGVDRLDGRPRITVIRPGTNTGFAGGCNAGAAAATGDVVALVNPDVLVDPTALATLARAATEPGIGIATASLRLADRPEILNSVGNPVHYLGLAWAGSYGEPASEHAQRARVATASGACCALRRSLWEELGGFDPAYFAYHEDVELSLRCWQRGLVVTYVPDAVAVHFYEFSRNTLKNQLLERNRWLTLLTLYSTRTLMLLAPALLVFELLMLLTAAAQGWLPAKVAGYRWLVANRAHIRQRRAQLQAERVVADRDLAPILAARIEPANIASPPGMPMLNFVLAAYWSGARRLL